jgi:PKD repeat protein
MRPSQAIKLGVWDIANSEFVDITNGVISIDTKTGSDSFEGFWDQPDTGQFVIVTRGDTADPNLNPLITANSLLTITIGDANSASSERILYGFITDVNVKYNKNEKQIVTINGTDLIGYLNRLIITEDFITDNITPTYPTGLVPVDFLLQYCVYLFDPIIETFFNLQYLRNAEFTQFAGMDSYWSTTPPTPLVKVEPGVTIYELISSGMSTGLIRSECQFGRDYFFMPYFKYDSTFYDGFWDNYYDIDSMHFVRTNETDPWQSDHEPAFSTESTYRALNLSNGLDRTINTVVVNNTNPANGDIFTSDPVTDDQAIIDYGPAKLDSSTGFTTTTNPFWLSSSTVAGQAQEYADNIIDWQSQPETIIDSVTIDMAKYYMFPSEEEFVVAPDNGSRMFVQHKLTDGTYISGYYVVCGVRHRITESEWFADFILRKSEYEFIKDNRPKKPEILLNTDTGTTATTFNASIDNYTSEDWDNVESIEWMVNYPATLLNNIPGNRPSEIFNTTFGLSVPIFTANTVSWTYDDGGVLEDYYIPVGDFLLNGPGEYLVLVWVKYKNGLTTISEGAYVGVTSAEAYADFAFIKNASEEVTFIDESAADTNTWDWDFGDGTTYSGQNPPKKIYATSGTFDVSLTVDNGYNTDTITKPVTINIYQIPVRYVRLRYQGTVTKAAGATDYTTDLIDTIGLVELKNTSAQQTGGIQPMYFSRVGTIDKVEDIGRGHLNAPVYNPENRGQYLESYGDFTEYDCYVPEVPAPPQIYDDYTEYAVYAAANITRVDGTNTNTYTYYNGPSDNGVGATLTFPTALTAIDGIPVSNITGTQKILIVGDFDGTSERFTNPNGGIYTFNSSTPTVMTRDSDWDDWSTDLQTDIYISIANGNKSWKPYVPRVYDFPEWTFVHYATNNSLGSFDYEDWPAYIPAIPAYTYQNRYYEDIVLGTTAGISGYTPNYSTDYSGQLNPMSQSIRTTWNGPIVRGTVGAKYPKYKFHPVITDNLDGSQTKSLDVDIIIEYSHTYIAGTSNATSTSEWRRWFNNQPAGLNATGGGTPRPAMSYLPGGVYARVQSWANWGAGGSAYDERFKLKEIKVWPGLEVTAFNNTGNYIITSNAIGDCDGAGDTSWYTVSKVSEFGITPEKTYLPISIAVSDDGVTYRKVAEAEYVSGSVMETTYTAPMPAFSSAPVEP